jgi:uncharacterized protein YjbI with pentapeptide repeats
MFIKPNERDEKAEDVSHVFIKQFKGIIKNSKRNVEIDCRYFVFPFLREKEWFDMWLHFAHNASNQGSFIDLHEPISFKGAEFGGVVYFKNSIFTGNIDFTEATFHERIECSFAHFSSEVFFKHATFFQAADFAGTNFTIANFQHSIFHKKAYFAGAHFNKWVSFGTVDIYGTATFSHAKFNASFIHFELIHFFGKSYFQNTEFSTTAFFQRALFASSADFSWTNFHSNVDCRKTIFLNIADFSNATFKEEVNFVNTLIRLLDLTKAEIHSFVRIRRINYSEENDRIYLKSKINYTPKNPHEQIEKDAYKLKFSILKNAPFILLRDLRFWENGQILLEDFNATNISLWQTNFNIIRPRIDFIRINWGKDKFILDDIYNHRVYMNSIPLSEIEMKLIKKPFLTTSDEENVEAIEWSYKQIRLTYERRGDYPDAGDFYCHEMKIRNKRLHGLLKFLHYIYGCISGYGESVKWASVCLLLILTISAIFLSFAGFEKSDKTFQLSIYFNKDCLKYTLDVLVNALFSIIQAFTFGGMSKYTARTTAGVAVFTCARIFGLTTFALLLLALRRRFRR